jgi:hypothetical protein
MTQTIHDLKWVETNSPISNFRTDDIWFANPEVGWLVNSSGQVCKTSDGGANWQQQVFLPLDGQFSPYLRCIHFANEKIGWFGNLLDVVDENDVQKGDYRKHLLHQTVDGGETWTQVENLPGLSPVGICGLSVVDENTIYGSGTNSPANNDLTGGAKIVKSVDGGQSWQLIDMSLYADNLIDIHFFDANRGWVVGGKKSDSCPVTRPHYEKYPSYAQLKPVVLRTGDGGQTWQNMAANLQDELPCGGWGWKIFWLDEKVGFVSVENFLEGAILKTTDGGDSWQRLPIDDSRLVNGKAVANANLEGVGFITPEHGWVGGWGSFNFDGLYNSITLDGGEQWTAEDHNPDNPDSDPRIAVNRYRFFFDDGKVTAGYCSGKMVYKLAAAALPPATVPAAPKFMLGTCPGASKGTVDISFTVPEGAKKLFVGIWNVHAWPIATLINESEPKPGRRTVTWDPNGPDAGYICRVMVDGACESEAVGGGGQAV